MFPSPKQYAQLRPPFSHVSVVGTLESVEEGVVEVSVESEPELA
jgi:hypothetical protein